MDLVATDWFKSTKRMDHVAQRLGCAAQVSFSNDDSIALSSFISLVPQLNIFQNFFTLVFYLVPKSCSIYVLIQMIFVLSF